LPVKKRKVASLSAESPRREFGASLRSAKLAVVVLLGILVLYVAACGRQADNSSNTSGKQEVSGTREQGATSAASSEKSAIEKTATGKTGTSGGAAELARTEVGKKEITNMIPADGNKPDAARPLPENPPKGIEVYPATTNASVEGPIEYERHPPTNGENPV
jgi:cytoskeletal protein RodZ